MKDEEYTIKRIETPITEKAINSLRAGDEVLLSGVIYTARDEAHLKMHKMIIRGKKLPVDFNNQIVYYCGPTPSGDKIIGSCGPTTSNRMDSFTPELLKSGLKGMIGKGRRSKGVNSAIKKYGAVYFLAPAGCGAYLSSKVKSAKVVAFQELGPEAIFRLEVKNFPLVVGIDSRGKDIYEKRRTRGE